MKKILVSFALLASSGAAISGLSDDQLIDRYQPTFKKANICSEIKDSLEIARSSYDLQSKQFDKVNNKISRKQEIVDARIEMKNLLLDDLDRLITEKKGIASRRGRGNDRIRKQQKRIIDAGKGNRDKINENLLITENNYHQFNCSQAQASRSRKCKAIAKNTINLRNQLRIVEMNIDSARLVLKNLGNNGELLAQINKQIQNKEIEISEYSNKRPTIEKLEARISELIQNRDNSNGDFALVEKNYGRLLVKLDKCKYIKRTAKKSEAFRESLPSFVQEGNCEYRNATHIASTYKNQAKKDGVFEAYDLMCGSDIMVRTIDVGQTCEEQGPRTQVIETYFSSNFEGESSYRNNLRAGNERVKVLKYPDAKRIRITIKHIDIEYSGNFDHLTITDSYGNEVAKLFNKSQGVPLGSYESPWFDGNSLQLTFHSDGFTTRSGFELYEFEVEL